MVTITLSLLGVITLINYQRRMWGDISGLYDNNPFTWFSDVLQALDITVSDALMYFSMDYNFAITIYDNVDIQMVFRRVAATNAKKYQKLLAVYNVIYNPINNYDMTETYTDTRTPNVTSTSSSSSESSSESSINQIKSVSDTPDNYQETTTHSVNTYDGAGLRTESQNVSDVSGTRTQTETYTGDPNSSSTSAEGTTTTTTTGTDTTQHYMTRSGNIGVTTTQQMISAEMDIAEKMNIFDVIKRDIAFKLFLGGMDI